MYVVVVVSKSNKGGLVMRKSLLADMFGNLCKELFVKHPYLMSDSDFREREKAIYKEIERYEAIMDVAGIV